MRDGIKNTSRKGDRQIMSVALPLSVYDALISVCEHYDKSRSDFITKAICAYLRDLGVKVGER